MFLINISFDYSQEIRRNEVFGHREIHILVFLNSYILYSQDAEEFYAYLLNAISSAIPTQVKNHSSNIIKDLFNIKYTCK